MRYTTQLGDGADGLEGTLAHLRETLARIRHSLREVAEVDRRLDGALAYSLDPAGDLVLARARYQRVLTERAAAVERLRATSQRALELIRETRRSSSVLD